MAARSLPRLTKPPSVKNCSGLRSRASNTSAASARSSGEAATAGASPRPLRLRWGGYISSSILHWPHLGRPRHQARPQEEDQDPCGSDHLHQGDRERCRCHQRCLHFGCHQRAERVVRAQREPRWQQGLLHLLRVGRELIRSIRRSVFFGGLGGVCLRPQ